jgi:hypothetical protein
MSVELPPPAGFGEGGDGGHDAQLTVVQRHPPGALIRWVITANPSLAEQMTSDDPWVVKFGWEKLAGFVADPTTTVPPAVISTLVAALIH